MTPGFVYVIDSPTPFDLLNGQAEGRSLCDELTASEIAYAYHVAADKEMLEIVLRIRVATECKRRALPPTIVLSMYTEERGLRLTSGELVTWEELRLMVLAVRHAHPIGTLVCFVRGHGGGLTDFFVRGWGD